ncbi:hypothetical protein GQ53DRAFT_166798 [Thozetella sp. PMI_491]|nr:hypothetical protein GQ53DRAFT_166798 [Thozetella sp. PMI_491]
MEKQDAIVRAAKKRQRCLNLETPCLRAASNIQRCKRTGGCRCFRTPEAPNAYQWPAHFPNMATPGGSCTAAAILWRACTAESSLGSRVDVSKSAAVPVSRHTSLPLLFRPPKRQGSRRRSPYSWARPLRRAEARLLPCWPWRSIAGARQAGIVLGTRACLHLVCLTQIANRRGGD